MSRSVLHLVIAAGAMAAAATGGVTTGFAQDRTIGVVAPLTGPAANTGEDARRGFELAVKEWNEGQGDYVTDNPPQVELVIEDSNSKPEVGVSGAQRLITRNEIDLLVGEALHSHVTMALMELAPQYNLPILSAEPVAKTIADKVVSDPERYKLYWKGNFNSDGYGRAVHQFYRWAFEQDLVEEGGKKIGFVVEDTDYGLSNAEQIGDLFGEDGWEVIGVERTQAGQTDFYPQLSKFRSLEPDIIVSVFTMPNSGTAFVRQLQEQDLDASHLAIYYPTKVEFMAEAAEIAEGMFWATLQYAPELIEEHKAFSDKIEAEYGSPGGYSSAHDYCVMKIALRALDTAGPDGGPEEIAQAISETDYQCVYGRWVFGEDHAAQDGPDFLPIPVAQIQDGKNQIIWPESVATAESR